MSSVTRLTIYLLPVTIISFALNIPKFLEVTVTEDNSTDVKIEPTKLRTDPPYIFWYLVYSTATSLVTRGLNQYQVPVSGCCCCLAEGYSG